MKRATGLLVIAFKTADMSRIVTGLHSTPLVLALSMATSTARLQDNRADGKSRAEKPQSGSETGLTDTHRALVGRLR